VGNVIAGTFVVGFLLTLIVVDAVKLLCGRLRPTFIEACWPDWSQCHADSSKLPLSSVDICQQADHYVLLDAQWVKAAPAARFCDSQGGGCMRDPLLPSVSSPSLSPFTSPTFPSQWRF